MHPLDGDEGLLAPPRRCTSGQRYGRPLCVGPLGGASMSWWPSNWDSAGESGIGWRPLIYRDEDAGTTRNLSCSGKGSSSFAGDFATRGGTGADRAGSATSTYSIHEAYLWGLSFKANEGFENDGPHKELTPRSIEGGSP